MAFFGGAVNLDNLRLLASREFHSGDTGIDAEFSIELFTEISRRLGILRANMPSDASREPLPNQFDGLDFSIHRRRRRNQGNSIAVELDAADEFLAYIALDR